MPLAADTSALEWALKRDRWIVVGSLGAVVLILWGVIVLVRFGASA